MSGTVELVLGGARSGKSDWAVERAVGVGGSVLFIATAEGRDADMQGRIARHRRRRSASWATVEEPLEVGARLRAERSGTGRDSRPSARADVAILDCLTLLVSNRMLDGRLDGDAVADTVAWVEDLQATLRRCAGHIIVVSNEVGSGVVPDHPLGRRFRDALGTANRALAERADIVRLLVAGLPITLKGEE